MQVRVLPAFRVTRVCMYVSVVHGVVVRVTHAFGELRLPEELDGLVGEVVAWR